jgi:AraC-like DNA-binding protein
MPATKGAGPSDVACACRPHGQPSQGASIVEDLADPAEPFDSGIAQDEPREVAIWLRPEPLSGVEALQATFLRHRYRPHAHPTWVVALMRRGAAAFDLEGHHHLAPPGSVFIVAPELVHTGDPATEAGYSYEVLYLTPELVAAAADESGGREPRLPRHVVVDDPPLARRLRALHACLRRGDSGLEAEERFVVAAAFLCRQLEPAPRDVRGPIRHRAVRRAVELLRERWAEPVTLPELAVHAGLSPSALVRQFHRELGLPPHSFQLNIRVLQARELLRRGRPPAEVALETGFYDQAHLTRVFKRAVGVPPQRFANA